MTIVLLLLSGCSAPPEAGAPAPEAKAAERIAEPSPAVAPASPERRAREAARSHGPARSAAEVERGDVPAALRGCFGCHRRQVASYLEHGMASSLGPVGTPAPGVAVNPHSGTRYEISVEGGEAWLTATAADGGERRQKLVGRIGAGLADTSWVTMEVDPATGAATGRLFFAPVETITHHGVELSPFELRQGSAGMDLALTADCLTCHTTDFLPELPGAASDPEGRAVYPANALGAGAFEHLAPLTCETCHGDARRHARIMVGEEEGESEEDLGLPRLGELDAGAQRDVCARCHLQGDARVELVREPRRDRPLAGQIPVLVPPPERQGDDYRFVSQLERLVLSPCFRGTPEMTCATCHLPHTGAAAQGPAAFEAACLACHGGDTCTRPPELAVAAVAGAPARTAGGCVDCHVRRSQPFDLPHIRSADHYIRRRVPPPRMDVPHRQFADPRGPLVVFDDGRLAGALATPEGERWRRGVEALGLVTLGRLEDAARRLAPFPAPGTPAALRPSAPPELVALETSPVFHHIRGLVLQAGGQGPAALAAFSDALHLAPHRADARMSRAQLRFALGDTRGALEDTGRVLAAHPRADAPWNLRAAMALRSGQLQLAAAAFATSVEIWPANAAAWHELGRLLLHLGQPEPARQALLRARALQPSRPGLAEDLAKL